MRTVMQVLHQRTLLSGIHLMRIIIRRHMNIIKDLLHLENYIQVSEVLVKNSNIQIQVQLLKMMEQ